VVLRRGPTDWVQMIAWDTESDTFTPGQWFHGRIYERRCDLSPNGAWFIYFARKIEARTLADPEYTYAWTAISRPPYFTALALWPKGDCWAGGGMFDTDRDVWLNHAPGGDVPHPRHRPWKRLRIHPNADVCGEDGPIWERRMRAGGWRVAQEGEFSWKGWKPRTLREEVWERRHPSLPVTLRLRCHGYDFSRPGGPYVESFEVDFADAGVRTLPEASWADFDQRGRLVFARQGRLFTAAFGRGLGAAREIVDLDPSRPESVAAPPWAHRWT
jgi:hypothetical protein